MKYCVTYPGSTNQSREIPQPRKNPATENPAAQIIPLPRNPATYPSRQTSSWKSRNQKKIPSPKKSRHQRIPQPKESRNYRIPQLQNPATKTKSRYLPMSPNHLVILKSRHPRCPHRRSLPDSELSHLCAAMLSTSPCSRAQSFPSFPSKLLTVASLEYLARMSSEGIEELWKAA